MNYASSHYSQTSTNRIISLINSKLQEVVWVSIDYHSALISLKKSYPVVIAVWLDYDRTIYKSVLAFLMQDTIEEPTRRKAYSKSLVEGDSCAVGLVDHTSS